MRPEAFECVDVTSRIDAFPLRSQQGAPRTPGLLHLGLLSSLAAVVVLPQIGLAGYVLASSEIRHMVAGQPLVAFQLAAALAFWIGIFAWPLNVLITRLSCRRVVEITRDLVSVSENRANSCSTWTEPLQSYRGVAHHIRSSLAGTRHELVLIHADARRSVLLSTADQITDADIGRMTQLLRLPQVPASEMYAAAKKITVAMNTLSQQPLAA
jgi:hypothetical protein